MLEEYSELRVLRVFGKKSAEVKPLLREAAEAGCPGLQLGEKEGELAICIQARTETEKNAVQLCDYWADHLRRDLGPAVFGMGQTSLAEATVDALQVSHKLMVAADEVTGRLLGHALQGVEAAKTVYDFGELSYAHPAKADKLNHLPSWAKRDGSPLMQVAGRAFQALRVSDADYALALVPPVDGCPAAALVCSLKGGWLQALPADAPSGLSSNWLLDLVRRAALELARPASVQYFRPGKPIPQPVLEEAAPTAQPAGSAPEQPAAEAPAAAEAAPVILPAEEAAVAEPAESAQLAEAAAPAEEAPAAEAAAPAEEAPAAEAAAPAEEAPAAEAAAPAEEQAPAAQPARKKSALGKVLLVVVLVALAVLVLMYSRKGDTAAASQPTSSAAVSSAVLEEAPAETPAETPADPAVTQA